MTTAAPSTALATIQPAFTDSERLALAGYLAGYRGLTREAYALDLRQFTTWCRARSLSLFAVRRADIEGFARDLEARGRARATVTRRLSTIAGFYKYAVEEEFLDRSLAAHVQRPRVDYQSHAVALDRNELGALLVEAGLGPPLEHALISLLALNGLRVSEATGADIEQLGRHRWHAGLSITDPQKPSAENRCSAHRRQQSPTRLMGIPTRRSGIGRVALPVSVGEVGSPYFLGGPLACPLGLRQRVIGMIRSIGRGVELVQRVDEEAAAVQDRDPVAVAGVELDPALGRGQAVCLALWAEELAAGGPVRPGRAYGDQEGGGVEDQPAAGSQQPGGLGYPAGRVAPQAGAAFGDSQVEAGRGQRDIGGVGLDERE
jgi:hypothetical protein